MLFGVPMQFLPPGRRPLSSGSRAGLGAALVLLAIVAVMQLADGGNTSYIGLLVAAPFLAAAFASWRLVLGVGILATVVGLVFVMTAKSVSLASGVNVAGIAFDRVKPADGDG